MEGFTFATNFTNFSDVKNLEYNAGYWTKGHNNAVWRDGKG